MTLVKASEAAFEYPVVGFSRKQGLLGFDDLQAMRGCHPAYVKDGSLIGMEIVDNSLRRWIVRSLDLKQPLSEERWWHMFTGIRYAEFDLELEEISPADPGELKRRFLEGVDVENPRDEQAVRAAPDLATMFSASNMQGSGLF